MPLSVLQDKSEDTKKQKKEENGEEEELEDEEEDVEGEEEDEEDELPEDEIDDGEGNCYASSNWLTCHNSLQVESLSWK